MTEVLLAIRVVKLAGLIELIRVGQEELEAEKLAEAEKTLVKALKACSTEEDRQEVLRCLLKLAGKYLRRKEPQKPKVLFEYLENTDIDERTRVMEWLARVHRETEDLEGAERIYTDIFELRAQRFGPENPEAVGALNTAALLRQMQGKSPEDLYVRAYKFASSAPPAKQEKKPEKTGNESSKDLDQTKEKENKENKKVQKAEKEDKSKTSAENKSDPKDNGPLPLTEHEKHVREMRKKAARQTTTTLHLLDELLINQTRPEEDKQPEQTIEEIPEFIAGPLTLRENLQELLTAWEPFCNQLTRQLVKLLQQSSNQAYRNTLLQLSTLLNEQAGAKQVNLENPFLAVSRRAECNYLDWRIVKELAPVYEAYSGRSSNYPFEIGMLYAALRRAFELGPLHIDTLQTLYRLAHIYKEEIFGCYDLDFSAAAFKICGLAFMEHPEIDDLTRIRCRTNYATLLMAKDALTEAKAALKEAIKLADSCEQVSRPELMSILKTLAECTSKIGDFETAAGVYERIRNFQEAVSRDPELFETFIHLIANHKKAGNEAQVQNYLQRLQWELDWLKDPHPMRETIASRAEELEQYELAELMLHEIIILQNNPTEPIAGRAANALIKIYEKTGRVDMANQLRGTLQGN